eukprot:2168579-Prymnesium_polylepis.1
MLTTEPAGFATVHEVKLTVRAADAPPTRSVPPPADAPSNGVFIGNLPRTVTADMLTELLMQCGPLQDLRLLRDPQGVPKGVAFCDYAEPVSAAYAISVLNGLHFGGRPLRVNEQNSRAPAARAPPQPFVKPSWGNRQEDGAGAPQEGAPRADGGRIVDAREDERRGEGDVRGRDQQSARRGDSYGEARRDDAYGEFPRRRSRSRSASWDRRRSRSPESRDRRSPGRYYGGRRRGNDDRGGRYDRGDDRRYRHSRSRSRSNDRRGSYYRGRGSEPERIRSSDRWDPVEAPELSVKGRALGFGYLRRRDNIAISIHPKVIFSVFYPRSPVARRPGPDTDGRARTSHPTQGGGATGTEYWIF